MPASSIPDTLLELGAAPGCQRKYQQVFMGSADYSLPLSLPSPSPAQAAGHPYRPAPQPTLTSPRDLGALRLVHHH